MTFLDFSEKLIKNQHLRKNNYLIKESEEYRFMEKLYDIAVKLQKIRDTLDDQRDTDIKALEPLKKYSLQRNREKLRSNLFNELRRGTYNSDLEALGKVIDTTLNSATLADFPDPYKDKVEEVRRQYRDSIKTLEKGYAPLFQNEIDRISKKVEEIKAAEKPEQNIDASTMQELQLMALRKDIVPRATLDDMAKKVKGSESALTLLDQIAERGTQTDMYGNHLPSHRYRNMYIKTTDAKAEAKATLRQLTAGIKYYLTNHSDRASRIQQEHYNQMHGTEIDSARWKFADREEFLRKIDVDANAVALMMKAIGE